jgi:solute:Na+ symporter, SSS family
VWQSCLTVTPIYIIIRQDLPLVTSIAMLLVTSLILKKNWYDKLKEEEKFDNEMAVEEKNKEIIASNV